MINAIYNCNGWYCKSCKIRHSLLYIDGKNHYCNNCLPVELRNERIQYMNQNRDIIDRIEEE